MKPSRFSVNSVLESVPDTFDAEFPDNGVFAAATEAERWTLTAGYLDALSAEQVIAQLRDGVVDVWGLRVLPNELRSTIRGRDAAAHLLDRQIRRRFLRAPRPAVLEQIDVADQEEIEESEGQFLASHIATTIADDLGFSMQWQVEDYTLQEDFEAIGTAIDILRQLAAPWSQTEPGRVDIWSDGEVIFIRQRPATLVAEATYTVDNDKIRSVEVEKRILPRVKRLVLRGQRLPQGGEGGVFVGGFTKEFVTDEFVAPAGGQNGSRVVTVEQRRMPDDLLLEQFVRRWQIDAATGTTRVTSEETLFQEWEDSIYDRGVPVNQPQLQNTIKETISSTATSDGELVFSHREECAYSYDSDRFLSAKLTRRFRPDSDGVPQEYERETEKNSDESPLSTVQTITVEGKDDEDRWFVKRSFTGRGSGFRVGGVRPPLSGTKAELTPVTLIEDDMSADPRALTVELDLRHFTLTQLQAVRDRIQAANDLTEHEVTFITSLPQIHKGQVIALTGVKNAAGASITFQPMLVTGASVRYDESREAARLVTTITAKYWAATV
jgi:hypothetical protein